MLASVFEASLVVSAILLGLFPTAVTAYERKLQSGDPNKRRAARLLPYAMGLGILEGFVVSAVALFRLSSGYDDLGMILATLFWLELALLMICTVWSMHVLRT